MNYKCVLNVLGKTLIFEAGFLTISFIIAFCYSETNNYFAFLLTIGILLVVGLIFSFLRPKDKTIHAKEGFVIVAFVWIFMSVFGALPFTISGEIPNYIDALFETVSGFTTTGASILSDLSGFSKSMMFWRMFTHFIGGMGVLVFVLAFLPGYKSSGFMHIFRAESPGPSVGKLVSKMSFTARILYSIYILLTVLETIMLSFKMPFYDALLYSFSTAGTGGFSITNAGLLAYNSVYVEMVVASFMFIFGINFNIFYLILIGQVGKAFKNEEFYVYISIIVVSMFAIAVNLLSLGLNFGEALRYSYFQTCSISSTTGLTTANFYEWPAVSKAILLFLTVIGASGGSTGGGIKVARLMILFKSSKRDVKKLLRPKSVYTLRLNGELLSEETVFNVKTYFLIWVGILIFTTVLLSIDFNDLFTNFSATLACLGNVGPGLTENVFSNYTIYSNYSKILLSIVMLCGRLEILPIIILFSPSTWKAK